MMSIDRFVATICQQLDSLTASTPTIPSDAKVDHGGAVTLTFRSSAIASAVRDCLANLQDLQDMAGRSLLLEISRAVQANPKLLRDLEEDPDDLEDAMAMAREFIEGDEGKALLRGLIGDRINTLANQCIGRCVVEALNADRALEV